MRISELSERSGVAVATIKYYLREGLLHPGLTLAPNRADYDDEHVRRLRLIRALIEVGGLSIASVVQTLAAVDDASVSIHDAFGVAQDALSPATPTPAPELGSTPTGSNSPTPCTDAQLEVDRWLRRRRWKVRPDAAARTELAETLAALQQFGWGHSASLFDGLADYALEQAGLEVGYLDPQQDRSSLMEQAIIGTVAFEQAYGAIRRLALEHQSYQRFGRRRSVSA